jgi:hypothetical protein
MVKKPLTQEEQFAKEQKELDSFLEFILYGQGLKAKKIYEYGLINTEVFDTWEKIKNIVNESFISYEISKAKNKKIIDLLKEISCLDFENVPEGIIWVINGQETKNITIQKPRKYKKQLYKRSWQI